MPQETVQILAQQTRPDKILWLFNSHSTTAALGLKSIYKYAALMGFGTNHVMGFDSGPDDGDVVGNRIYDCGQRMTRARGAAFAAIKAYATANDCDSICCALGMPLKLDGTEDIMTQLCYAGRVDYVDVIDGGTVFINNEFTVGRSLNSPMNWRGTPFIPVGRLGIPDRLNLAAESIDDLLTLTRASIAADAEDNSVKRMLQGFFSRGGASPYTNSNHLSAWRVLRDYGCENRGNYAQGTLDNDVNLTEARHQTLVPLSARELVMQQSERIEQGWSVIGSSAPLSPKIPFFIYVDCAFTNQATEDTDHWSEHFDPAPGSMAYNWTSYGYWMILGLLKRGLSVGFGSIGEPLASRLADMAALTARWLMGFNAMECYFYAGGTQGWPVGNPYACHFGKDGLRVTPFEMKGIDGANGTNGLNGADGSDSQPDRQLLVNSDFENTTAEWNGDSIVVMIGSGYGVTGTLHFGAPTDMSRCSVTLWIGAGNGTVTLRTYNFGNTPVDDEWEIVTDGDAKAVSLFYDNSGDGLWVVLQ